jgi:DNA recombination-dependent growth factor C
MESIVSDIFFSKLSDDDSNDIDISNNKVVSFSIVVDKKKLPKKKIERMLEDSVNKYLSEHKKDPEDLEKDEMKDEIVKLLSVGQHPQRSSCGVIIDLREKLIYIEKKGWMSDFAAVRLNVLCGLEMKYWVPFAKPMINKIPAKTMFLQWLYLSMEKAKIELNVNSELTLSNDIKFFDDNNKITVKGNIVKFIDVYKKIMQGAKVEECTVKIADQAGDSFEYGFKLNDSYIHNFCIKGRSYGGNEYELAISRCEEFNKFKQHLKNLVKIFEKTME